MTLHEGLAQAVSAKGAHGYGSEGKQKIVEGGNGRKENAH